MPSGFTTSNDAEGEEEPEDPGQRPRIGAARDQHAGDLVDDDRARVLRRRGAPPHAPPPRSRRTITIAASPSERQVGRAGTTRRPARPGDSRRCRARRARSRALRRSRSSGPAAIRGPPPRAAQRRRGSRRDRSRRPRAISTRHSTTGREVAVAEVHDPVDLRGLRSGPALPREGRVLAADRRSAPRGRCPAAPPGAPRRAGPGSPGPAARAPRRPPPAPRPAARPPACPPRPSRRSCPRGRSASRRGTRAASRTPPRVSPGKPTSTVVRSVAPGIASRSVGDDLRHAPPRHPAPHGAEHRRRRRAGSACRRTGARAPVASFRTSPSVTCAGWR